MRTTSTALLALAAVIPLTTAWPNFRREPASHNWGSWERQAPTSTAAVGSKTATPTPGPSAAAKKYKYVLAISVDGMHSSDVEKYLAIRPKSTIASLLATGYEYTDAFTSAVSGFSQSSARESQC